MIGTLIRKKDWVLNQRAFDRLLSFLDPDRETAAEKYEALRTRLVAIFRWRRCLSAERLADETFDRVSRRLDEGEQVRAEEPAPYFYGVARNVLKEYWTNQQREKTVWQVQEAPQERAMENPELERAESDERLGCLERCMGHLPHDDIELITRYYPADEKEKIGQRAELAKALKITVGALRTRAHRIRRRLEDCTRECMRKRADG